MADDGRWMAYLEEILKGSGRELGVWWLLYGGDDGGVCGSVGTVLIW